MNPLERQLSALLKDTPGEPPSTVDADALLAKRSRRRYLAPSLAAAAIVAIAVPLAVLLTCDSGTLGSAHRPMPHTSPTPADPKTQAIMTARALVDSAPVPPGSTRIAHSPLALLDRPSEIPGALHVQRTAFWTVPGTTDAAVTYLRVHPPEGFRRDGSGAMGGPGRPTVEDLSFATGSYGADGSVTLLYSVVAFDGGVAIRVDAQVFWVPNRPAWSYVPASVISVDVTVIRKAYTPGQRGAPTVSRTLTGDAARQLADAINALPPVGPEGVHSCPAQFIQSSDIAIFHAANRDIRVARVGGGCAFDATVTAPPSKRQAYLGGPDVTSTLLSALGLPANYGSR